MPFTADQPPGWGFENVAVFSRAVLKAAFLSFQPQSGNPHVPRWRKGERECGLATRRRELLSHAITWMDLETVMPGRRSQTQKDKGGMIPWILAAQIYVNPETEEPGDDRGYRSQRREDEEVESFCSGG